MADTSPRNVKPKKTTILKKVSPSKVREKVVIIGRDQVAVDREGVRKLAALGCTKSDIANFYGVKVDTLNWHFSEDFIQGFEEMKISLRRSMIYNAVHNNNAALQIFLSKNYLGLRDIPLDTEANIPLPWNTPVKDMPEEDNDNEDTD